MRAVAVAGSFVLLVTVTACGVRPQDSPARLDPTVVPTERPAARPVVTAVYFLRNGRAVPARRLVVAPATPEQRLAELARGPGDVRGLTTALDRDDPPRVTVTAGVAVVALPASFARLPAGERRLAAAQVVLTLTEADEVAVVRFTLGGRAFGVPRADGSLSRDPLTRADYAALTG